MRFRTERWWSETLEKLKFQILAKILRESIFFYKAHKLRKEDKIIENLNSHVDCAYLSIVFFNLIYFCFLNTVRRNFLILALQ